MTRTYEYDLYFPFVNKAGVRVADKVFNDTKQKLTEFFGGLTDFQHRTEGRWTFGGVTYFDDVVLLRMLSDDPTRAREFVKTIQRELEATLEQQEILVIEREVSRI